MSESFVRKPRQSRLKSASVQKENPENLGGERVVPRLPDSENKLFSTIERAPEFEEAAFLKRYADIVKRS